MYELYGGSGPGGLENRGGHDGGFSERRIAERDPEKYRDIGLFLTIAALVIAIIAVYLVRASLVTSRKTLELARQALQMQSLEAKPQFNYELTATIYPSNPKKNDYQAVVELVRGAAVRDVNIIIRAGLIDGKREEVVFNYWTEAVQPGEVLKFNKSNAEFAERMERNLMALDPNVFLQKKLTHLKLYAEYVVNLPNKDVVFNDDEIGNSERIVPDYK